MDITDIYGYGSDIYIYMDTSKVNTRTWISDCISYVNVTRVPRVNRVCSEEFIINNMQVERT